MNVDRTSSARCCGPNPGQQAKSAGTDWPGGRARPGTAPCNPLGPNGVLRLDHKAVRERSLKPLVFLGETALQPWLRQVCGFCSPVRAKGTVSRPLLHRGRSLAFPSGWVFGAVLAAMLAVSSAHAEGWKKTSASAGWSSADRFTSELPRQNEVVASGSFEAFLGTLRGGELTQLMDLISRAESPHLGYDSVQKRARIKPPRKPSQMTLGGIFT